MNSVNLFLLLVLLFGVQIYGHSYVTQPVTLTNQAQSETGCRVDAVGTYGPGGTNCPGPCDNSGGSIATQTTPYPTQRGATIDVRWARNNHPGGFVRFAWAPTSSTTNAQFDAYSYRFECFEKGPFCAPSGAGATGDATTDTQTGCGTNITVPAWVTDGTWTLQWAWFGGYDMLGDYYSCANYQVSGGTTVNAADSTFGNPTVPVFAGGDYANPNSPQCQFRNTDRLHQCVQENCNAPLYTLGQQQTGVPTLTNGGAVLAVATIYPIVNAPSPSSNGGNAPIPCSNNTQCASGTCDITGFCYVASHSKLGPGGIAAIVFAFIFVAMVAAVVGFMFINRSEWSNWKVFNKFATKNAS